MSCRFHYKIFNLVVGIHLTAQNLGNLDGDQRLILMKD